MIPEPVVREMIEGGVLEALERVLEKEKDVKVLQQATKLGCHLIRHGKYNNKVNQVFFGLTFYFHYFRWRSRGHLSMVSFGKKHTYAVYSC